MSTKTHEHRLSAEDIKQQVSDWSQIFDALAPSLHLRGRGEQRHGRCPFHDDRNPSFSVNLKSGKWTCFSGCGKGDGLSFAQKALGVDFPTALSRVAQLAGVAHTEPYVRTQAPLTLAGFAEAKGFPVKLLTENGWNEAKGVLQVTYRNLEGKPAPRVRRRWALAAGAGSSWDGPKNEALIPYGLWRLHQARHAKQLFLVEGETDALTLWLHGFPALGLPGARTVHLLEAHYLEGIETVYVTREPDEGGDHFVADVVRRVRRLGWLGTLKEIALVDGDVNDLHRHDPQNFQASLLGLMSEACDPDVGNDALPRLPPPAPFPIMALPEPLATFVTENAAALVCPPDFIGLPLIASCAAAIGNTCEIEVKRGWYEGARVYAAVVAEPGSKKSPALKAATAPVWREQQRLSNEHRHAMTQYKGELELHEQSRRSKDEPPPGAPEKPTFQQVYVADTTIEALAQILQDNPRGVLMVRDELAAWVRDQGRYQQGRSGDRKQWLSFWSGEPLVVNRKSLPDPITIDKPLVNVVGALLPDALPELLGDTGYSDGFIERILFAFPDPVATRWSEAEILESLEHAVDALFRKLWSLGPGEDWDGRPQPRTFRFSPEAKELFVGIMDGHYDEMNSARLSDALQGSWSKLEAYFARLALVIHICRFVQGQASEAIDEESVLRASVLWEYFKNHARRVAAYVYGSEADKQLAKALRWIRRRKETIIPVREILNAKVGGVTSMEEVAELLGKLEARGVGLTVEESTSGRGRKKTVFRLASGYEKKPP